MMKTAQGYIVDIISIRFNNFNCPCNCTYKVCGELHSSKIRENDKGLYITTPYGRAYYYR